MSFKESEFPDLIESILKMGTELDGNSVTFEIVRKVSQLVKQIPLYPGIVGMCLAKYVESVAAGDLKEGDRIFIRTRTRGVLGKFEGIEGGKICVSGKTSEKIDESEAKQILRFRENILEEIWPTLVFKEER